MTTSHPAHDLDGHAVGTSGGRVESSVPRMPAEPPRRPRRTRTPRPADAEPAGYAQAWALFTDWCAATNHRAQPSAAATVLAFLQACPAATATQRRRVAAIDHHHRANGQSAPGDHGDVRAAIGRPPKEQVWVCPDRDAVDAALRALPSHGFTAGLFGQRDRALLVLAQIAGLPYRAIATLTAGHLEHDPDTGTVGIAAGGRRHFIEPAGTAVTCPACVLTRWMTTHAVLTRHIATRPLADHLHRLDSVTETSAHACRQPAAADRRPGPLLPPINQWGQIPFPPAPLTPHAVSHRTGRLIAGEQTLHRDIPPTSDIPTPAPSDPPAAAPPTALAALAEPAPTNPAGGWAGRRADRRALAGLSRTFDDIEQRAADIDHRLTQLLGDYSQPPNRPRR